MPFTFAIVGASNSGKTTLITRLIPVLRARGLRVGTIKHDAHSFEVDYPGKDTWRHREAGAEGVLITGGGRLAFMAAIERSPGPSELAAAYFPEMDLVLVEGFKHHDLPRLEVVRAANTQWPACPIESLSAIATDMPLAFPGVQCFELEAIEAIAAYITGHLPVVPVGPP